MIEPRKNVHANFGGECKPGDISPYVLLPTDARQVEILASHWENAREVTRHYEYLIYSGEYQGVSISACSLGIGGVSTATAIEELAQLGAHSFIHIGLANPPFRNVAPNHLTIAKGAVRYDGTSHDYVRPEFPALASFEILMALIAAAENQDRAYDVGVVASLASPALVRNVEIRKDKITRASFWQEELEQAGVYGGSGEEATLFVQAALYGLRAGSITANPRGAEGQIDTRIEEEALVVALKAMYALVHWDQEASALGNSYILPQ